MACTIDLTISNLVLLGVLAFAAKKLYKFYQSWKLEKMLEKFNSSPRDKVILHTIPRCKVSPNISPFALKLETYLRLAKIPYELDTTESRGPKGKFPWITLNGIHMGDSELIIRFLNRKLGINLNSGKSDELVAAAKACAVLLESHFSWAIAQYRFVENSGSFSTLMKVPPAFKVFLFLSPYIYKKKMAEDGIGLHTPTEIYQLTEADLHTVSTLLGNKKFFGGEEPCEADCTIFGVVAQAVWGMPGSSCERLVHGELINLKKYCDRMKDRTWPDWENCIDKN